MLGKKSNFTLIELIVVVVVLGILAAIVVPNISNFSKDAKEAAYDADARAMQTAADLFSAKSVDLTHEGLKSATTGKATLAVDSNGEIVAKDVDYNLIDFAAADKEGKVFEGGHLRKVPTYIATDGTATADKPVVAGLTESNSVVFVGKTAQTAGDVFEMSKLKHDAATTIIVR